MFRIFFLLFLVFGHTTLWAQSIRHPWQSPAFTGYQMPAGSSVYHLTSANEDQGIVRAIMDVVGLKPNFELRPADISNAVAVVYNGKRYILYDKAFIQSINNASSTPWAGISILAHEIGHHLNGHTLGRGGSNHKDELEADEFSGFVLRKLGASLEEAQAAMQTISSRHETATHPERRKRLQAIALGWDNAGGQTPAAEPRVERSEEYARQEPVSVPEKEAPQVLASQYILGEVHFTKAPHNTFYVTTNHNLVAVQENQLVLYGKMKKTNSRQFPYVLTDDKSTTIYVSENGYLYNEEGSKVGVLREYRG